ncbi:putative bifunctional diguanylate cyclase/phosphodiesterase [Alteripontixanthobacter maritimus]|uniref:putative bifunctional diguanylate cyclase/phosphodiesterase n=1 Tax=Alteripontixanthobacter maritimus TaxID=2161824 RepID=UPI0015F10882|nr:EAL domain-containing protein [Alteripontixanthobacter maritimus]
MRVFSAVAIYSFFMPALLLALIAGVGIAAIAYHAHIERCARSGRQTYRQSYRRLRDLMLVRGVMWAGIYMIALAMAPPAILSVLLPAAVMIMFVDGLCMIAMPRRALVAVGLQAIGIATPAVLNPTAITLISAVVAGFSFLFLHWALFNLNYLFATRRLRTRELTHANETIQLLMNQYDEDGSDWLFECDEKGAILRPNDRFCQAAQLPAHEMNGMLLSLIFDDCPEREELRAIGKREDNFRNHVIPLTLDGEKRWWSISARPIYDDEGILRSWRGFISDVTRTRQAEAKVTYMAHYDVLTNLANRSLFNITLQRAFVRRDPDDVIGVLYVDLDHFKAVNDTHGHALGDMVLAEAARRIENAVPDTAMVARLGGDEFAVVLASQTDRSAIVRIAHNIVSAMDDPVEAEGQSLPIGASIGVAFAPENGLDGDTVLRAADLALYDAKAKGRRGVSLFDPDMQEEMQDRRTLELDLRAALGRGELELFYQPLVSAIDSVTVGYEALLRWNHPTRGQVSPAVFIPIAEETGQIVQIGTWVLREALREAATWPEELSVSVNLSPAQMADDSILTTVVGALAQTGVPASRLELEITETLLMQDNPETIAVLHKLRDMGVKIALDDFGTGYSSLNYLRSFPFDKIKIDRCFVEDIAEKKDSDAIVRAVIGLAEELDMRTTAEGVETAHQLAQLRQNGCTHLQGFLFSKARPASELAHKLAVPGAPAKEAELAVEAKPVTQIASKKRARKAATNAPAKRTPPKRKSG